MLDKLVSILPESQRDKAKAYIAWLGTVASVLVIVLDGTPPRWLVAAIAVLTALGVYAVPNVGYDAKHDGPDA